MEIAALLIIITFYLGIFIVWKLYGSYKKRDDILKEYTKAAAQLGLEFKGNRRIRSFSLSGTYEGMELTTIYSSVKMKPSITVFVDLSDSEYESWQILSEGLISTIQMNQGLKDIEIGDPHFDKRFKIKADEPDLVLAQLDVRTRELMCSLEYSTSYFEVSDRRIVVSFPTEKFGSIPVQQTRDMLELGKRLRMMPDLQQTLIDNALHDKDSDFRIQNLEILLDRFPGSEDTISTLRNALKDANKMIRVYAAGHLGPEGQVFLGELLQAELLQTPILKELLGYLEQGEKTASALVLEDFYREKATHSEKKLVLQTLARLKPEGLQGFLLEQLSRTDDVEEKTHIVHQLGMCGNREAIEALYLLQKKSSNARLDKQIHHAITEIRQRHAAQGDPGWLSLAEVAPAEGGLSIPGGDEDGALSMAEEE